MQLAVVVAVAVVVVLVVLMLIIPLPAFLVDFVITLNIAGALAILVATMYMRRALEFAVFPSLLLICWLGLLVRALASKVADSA